jgi:cyclopropane-fatty-acyl-phospholipid synthase
MPPKERGLRVTALTISQAQHDLRSTGWRARGCRTGWRSSCRTIATNAAAYDGIASIEMFEAVGERYWPVYFEACASG